jgi:Tol biopolymer transport system component
MWSLARETLTRLTFDADVDLSPVWTPDGRRIVFSSARTGAYNLYALDISRAGTDQRLTRSANTQLPDSVTADGASVIAHEVQPQTRSDIERVSLAGPNGAPARGEPLVHGPFDDWNGEVSPDGSLLAFQSGGAGTQEIYVSPYPDVSRARWQISSGGGQAPAWTRRGGELIYVDGSGRLTAVAIQRSGGDVHAISRTPIGTRSYASPVPWRSYDVSADGQRFLIIREDETTHASPIQFVVVQHWFDELRRILPTS